jgi:hypothetical protein
MDIFRLVGSMETLFFSPYHNFQEGKLIAEDQE